MLRIKDLLKVCQRLENRCFSTTPVCDRKRSGKYRATKNRSFPVTYEMAGRPQTLAHLKSWNSWNTSALFEHTNTGDMAIEDEFIRRFMTGTWHNLFLSEVIIKRQHNIIRIAGLIYQGIPARKMYFLIGYCEELLSYWLQCPVKLELQTVSDRKAVVFKYI